MLDTPGPSDELPHRPELPAGPTYYPIHLQTPAGEMRLLTTIATNRPLTTSPSKELRLETLLPAAEDILRHLAG